MQVKLSSLKTVKKLQNSWTTNLNLTDLFIIFNQLGPAKAFQLASRSECQHFISKIRISPGLFTTF